MDRAVILIFHSTQSQRRYLLVSLELRRMFAYKGRFGFDWITLIDSLTVIPFSYGEKKYSKNLAPTTSACWILKLDFSISLLFRSAESQRRYWCIRLRFRVWYVQCLAKRLTLNFIEFIQWKVWRSYSIAVKNFMKNLTTTKSAARLQNPTAFVAGCWRLFKK